MIKNIIFDFGDVFIDLDKPATDRHLKAFGIEELPSALIEVNKAYEQGKISSAEIISAYTTAFPQLSSSDFIEGWNSILKDFPQKRLDFLKQLKKSNKYNLFLLSNTNDIHINYVKDTFAFYDTFKSCFDRFYLSYEIGFRKPNKDIYTFVLNDSRLKPEETLFIDDSEENIISANSLGIQTWHLNPKTDDVTELFNKIITS